MLFTNLCYIWLYSEAGSQNNEGNFANERAKAIKRGDSEAIFANGEPRFTENEAGFAK